jgi:membrane protein required for colicin V production
MIIDIIFAILAGYGFYLGFSKGIIQTVFTVLSVTFGLMAGFRFGPQMTKFLETVFNDNNALWFIAGFLLSFVLTMVLIRLFASGVEGLLQSANINIINKVAGGILLAGLMILMYSMILWFAESAHLIDEATEAQSLTYDYLEEFPTTVWTLGERIKPTFEEFWDHSIDFMDKLEDMSVERSESDPSIYDLPDDEDQ